MKRLVLSVLAALSLSIAFPAGQAEALNLGPLEVKPYLDFSYTYDDNIFVQNGGEVDDSIFLVSPGILLRLPQRDNLFELEYNADIYRYVDTGDANDVEDHNLRGSAEINFAGGLSIRLDDSAGWKHEARSEANLAVTGVTPISKYNFNKLDVEVEYAISERFSAAVGYQNYSIGYSLDANKFRDRMDHGASATVYYRFMPKTSLLLEGIYRNVYHTDDSSPAAARLNSEEYWVLTGLKWDITAKTTGSVRVGYEWKDFEHPASSDFDSGVYLVGLEHNFTSKTSVKLSGQRQARETDDPVVSHYTTTTGTLEARFRPVGKLSVVPFGSYTHNRYSGETTAAGDTGKRADNVWDAGIEIGYEMNKWIRLSVGYTHTKRSSNLPFYDYTDNAVTVGLRASI